MTGACSLAAVTAAVLAVLICRGSARSARLLPEAAALEAATRSADGGAELRRLLGRAGLEELGELLSDVALVPAGPERIAAVNALGRELTRQLGVAELVARGASRAVIAACAAISLVGLATARGAPAALADAALALVIGAVAAGWCTGLERLLRARSGPLRAAWTRVAARLGDASAGPGAAPRVDSA